MTKVIKNQYSPQIVFHPGVTLAEKLEEMKMSIKEFSVRTGKPEKTVIAVLNGESSITSEMAVVFENVLEIPAHFWMNRQRSYDEFRAREKRNELTKGSISWMKNFPVNEMIKRGWLPECKTPEDKTKVLLSFFGFSSHTAWENYYLNQELKVGFRISLAHSKSPEAISAWLRRGEIDAASIETDSFSIQKLKLALPKIKLLMAHHPKDFFNRLKEELIVAGIKLVATPCLPGAPINGATRWLTGDSPLIQISDRYKRNDIFWFTIFHEIGHIFLHGKKNIFLEDLDFPEMDTEKEREADNFAVKWTLSKEEEAEIINDKPITIQKIQAYASKFTTHSSIIVGRLQKLKLISHSQFISLVKKIDFSNTDLISQNLSGFYSVNTLIYENTHFELNEKLDLKVSFSEDNYIIENDDLGISAWGKTLSEAKEGVAFNFYALYLNYFLEKDYNLSSDAIELRLKLKNIIKSVSENKKFQ